MAVSAGLGLALGAAAQQGPVYTLEAHGDLTLVDVTAVDHNTLVPDNPEAFSEALAAILDRLHGRYQIGFVPPRADGEVHRLRVELTPAAKRLHHGVVLHARTEYRAPDLRPAAAPQAGPVPR